MVRGTAIHVASLPSDNADAEKRWLEQEMDIMIEEFAKKNEEREERKQKKRAMRREKT